MMDKEIKDANKCREMLKGNILKVSIINDFVNILKLKNSFDTETTIKGDDLLKLIDYADKNKKRISTVFNIPEIQKETIEDKQKFRLLYPFIEKCINNWSGCYLVAEKKDRNHRPTLLKLNGVNYFNIMKEKHIDSEIDFIE